MAKYDSYRDALAPLFGTSDEAEENWKSFLKTVPKGERKKWWARRSNFQSGENLSLDLVKKCIEAVGGEMVEKAIMPDKLVYRTIEKQ